MRVVVCVKRVLDPEAVNGYALWGRLAVDESGLAFEAAGDLPSIINAYDEQALEAALRLRDAGVDCQISVVAVGSDENADILRRCVAMGADEAILVQDQNRGVDGFRTARVLSGLIESIGDVDLVLCGRQGSDYDQGCVPGALAEMIGASLVTMAAGIALDGDAIRVTRAVPNGQESVRATLPAVVSVSNELGLPRYPTNRGVMQARRMPLQQRSADEFLGQGDEDAVELVRLMLPDVQGHCEIVEGANAREKAERLLARLREDGLLHA